MSVASTVRERIYNALRDYFTGEEFKNKKEQEINDSYHSVFSEGRNTFKEELEGIAEEGEEFDEEWVQERMDSFDETLDYDEEEDEYNIDVEGEWNSEDDYYGTLGETVQSMISLSEDISYIAQGVIESIEEDTTITNSDWENSLQTAFTETVYGGKSLSQALEDNNIVGENPESKQQTIKFE